MTLQQKIERLKKLEKDATQGPWKWRNEWEPDKSNHHYNGCVNDLEPDVLWFGMDGEEGIYCPKKADSELITESRNDLPELLEALEEAIAVVESVASEKFGEYRWDAKKFLKKHGIDGGGE